MSVRDGNVQITEQVLECFHEGRFTIPAAAAQDRRELGRVARKPRRHATDLFGQCIGHGKGSPPVCDFRLNGSQQGIARLRNIHRQPKTHPRNLPAKQSGHQLSDVYRCTVVYQLHCYSFSVFSANYKGGFYNLSLPFSRIPAL